MPTPEGLKEPITFGRPEAIQSTLYPFNDEQALGGPQNLPTPPPVAIFPVDSPTKIVATKPTTGSVVIAGDGDGHGRRVRSRSCSTRTRSSSTRPASRHTRPSSRRT